VKLTNRWLLLLELGLVLGLGRLLVNGADTLGRLNASAPLARYTPPARPSPWPTPILRLVDLPGSALARAEAGITPSPELPPGVNWRAASAPGLPIVPPTPDARLAEAAQAAAHATGIVIPAIGVDAPVVHGVGAESLKRGVGHYDASANPGEAGNVVLAGHNDVYGEVFRDLDRLQAGDELTLYSQLGQYRYRVREWFLVDPSEVSVLAPTSSPTVTLISCHPYLVDNHRIVVVADLINS
jgi:sortase A